MHFTWDHIFIHADCHAVKCWSKKNNNNKTISDQNQGRQRPDLSAFFTYIKDGEGVPLRIKGNSYRARKLLLFMLFLTGFVSLKMEPHTQRTKKQHQRQKNQCPY